MKSDDYQIDAQNRIVKSGSGSEPPANPDPISPASMELAEKLRKSRWAHPEHDTGCLVCGQTFLKAQGHQCGPESPPVGLLQALRDGIRAIWLRAEVQGQGEREKLIALVGSVEEQLAALQRENERLLGQVEMLEQEHERLRASLARGSSPSSPKGDA